MLKKIGMVSLFLVQGLLVLAPVFGAPKEQPAETVVSFKEVERLAQEDPAFSVEVYRLAGQRLLNRNQPARAAAMYEQALKINPANIQVMEELADAHLAAGQAKEAMSTWEQTMQSQRQEVGARVRYANFLVKAGEAVRGIEIMRGVAAQQAGNASLRYWIVDAYARQGKTAESLAELQKMRKEFPQEEGEIKRRMALLEPQAPAARK